MRFKHGLILFLLGLLFGIGLSPLAQVKPQKAFIAPVSVSFAEESVADSGQVLGAKSETKDGGKNRVMLALLTQQDKDLGRGGVKTSQPEDKSQTKTQKVTSQNIKIAVYGDSMIDTMGTDLPYLKKALQVYYPQVEFTLLNYGTGAQNIEEGLSRLSQPYSYKDRNYPSPLTSGADIIVIESFAYNPMGEEGLDKQWQALAQIVEQARSTGARVLLLAAIAPTKTQFGQGPGGIDWPPQDAGQHADLICRYLENALNLGKSMNIPLVDAYHATLLNSGEGSLNYISSHDHIHPSAKGHQLVANLIAQKIAELKLIP